MLHELVHNVQGPHNAVFYKLLDEISEVYAAITAVYVWHVVLLFVHFFDGCVHVFDG